MNEETKSEEKIESKFGVYGLIERVTVVEKEKGIFAFVKYQQMESAVEAINKENGTEWEGTRIVVEFSEAMESKRNRRQKATQKKHFSSMNTQPNYFSPSPNFGLFSPQMNISESPSQHQRYHSIPQRTYGNQLNTEERVYVPAAIPRRTYNSFDTISSPMEPLREQHQYHYSDTTYSPFDSLSNVDNSKYQHLPIFTQMSTQE